METFKAVVPYVASAFAIAVGLMSVTAPPIFTLSRDLAIAFIVSGFGFLGISVAVPAVRENARRGALLEFALGRRERKPRAPRTTLPKTPGEYSYSEETRTTDTRKEQP